MQNRSSIASNGAAKRGAGIRQREIFLNALELPNAVERGAFVHLACGKNQRLRRQVEELLTAHEEAGTFLEAPAFEETSRSEARWRGGPDGGEETRSARIGCYKLIRRIGEGGCGVVYMAERDSGTGRRVALKVIKAGLGSKTAIARFKAERRTLALMDHPNIARILDGGDAEDGRPYLVLELVRGMPVADYCDKNRLVVRDRLALFITVCHAIQYAHEKGVVHRDIKPSNILVTRRGGISIPKVIDFGIAVMTDPDLADGISVGAERHLAGTPSYMSPEQADISGPDVDTRTDIYSLGAVLYQMLTGRPPFDPKDYIGGGLNGMRHVIRETEPLPPSACLQKILLEKKTRAGLRKCRASMSLGSVLEGEWDGIVMKAMDKDRRRRYETAAALAAAVQRRLDHKPGSGGLSVGYDTSGAWRRE